MNLIDSLEHIQIHQENIPDFSLKNTPSDKNRQGGSILKNPEIYPSRQQIYLPGFDKDTFSTKTQFLHRFTKIFKDERNTYRIFLFLDVSNNQLFIQAAILTESLLTFKASHHTSLHLMNLFSIFNARSQTQSFRIDPYSLQITINTGFLDFSKNNESRKIDSIVNEIIESLQHNYAQMEVGVHQRQFLNKPSINLCEPALKCVAIVSQVLNNQCSALNEMEVTRNETSLNKQKPLKSKVAIKHQDKISKVAGISTPKQNQKITKKDLEKLLNSAKQSGDKTFNHLCLQVEIQQPQKLRWIGFAMNQNSKIEVSDAKLTFTNNRSVFQISIVNKKHRTQNGLRQLHNTKRIYQKIKDKNCINILKSYTSKGNQTDQLFTDYCRYGSLSNYIKKNKLTLSLKTKLYFLLQIVTGLQFLQSQNIIHMDIKPSNVLISVDLWVKLSDFGQAIFQQDKNIRGWTAPYVAPEVLSKSKVDSQADIYSFGVLVYQVLSGKSLFARRTSTMHKFGKDHQFEPPPVKLHPESLYEHGPQQIMIFLHQLILKCVDPIKNSRPSVDSIILVLKSLIGLVQYLLIANREE